MKHVFVDSGDFFAHLISEDVLHARARELFVQAEREDWHLVTTNAVVYETHALLINRAREGREAGLRPLDHVQRGPRSQRGNLLRPPFPGVRKGHDSVAP